MRPHRPELHSVLFCHYNVINRASCLEKSPDPAAGKPCVIAKRKGEDDGAEAAALVGKGVWISNAGGGHEARPLQQFQAGSCVGSKASKLGWLEPCKRDGAAWCDGPDVGCQSERAGAAGSFAGDDDEIGPTQRTQRLAPGPHGERRRGDSHRLGRHHGNVEITLDAETLIGIVQHDNLGTAFRSLPGPCQTVWVLDDNGWWEEAAVKVALVTTIAPQEDPGAQAAARVMPGDPGCEGRLSRSANGEVANRDGRETYGGPAKHPGSVGASPGGNGASIQQGGGQEREARQTRRPRLFSPQPPR